MRSELVSKSAGTRAAVIDALQTLQTEDTNLAFDSGQLIETDASIRTLRSKIEETSRLSWPTKLIKRARRSKNATELPRTWSKQRQRMPAPVLLRPSTELSSSSQ